MFLQNQNASVPAQEPVTKDKFPIVLCNKRQKHRHMDFLFTILNLRFIALTYLGAFLMKWVIKGSAESMGYSILVLT